MEIDALNRTFAANRDRYVAEWRNFVRFPSVSADPAHDGDCRACAAWLADHLSAMGLKADLLETQSKPVVFAERGGAPGAPTVLLYGHYDVQPADPVADWKTPPFDAVLKDGRLYGRGAQDNKGQLLYGLKAIEHLISTDRLRPAIKIVVEGEEESGGDGLSGSLEAWRDMLKADILMVHDTGAARSGAPGITMGLRGILHLAVRVSGPVSDLHSGMHGGLAPNPAAGMVKLLAGLHNADGSIAVEGYYDGVEEPTPRERELAASDPFDEAEYERATGVPPVGGENRFPPLERAGFRPTIEINGINSGYAGKGMKTIIPAGADAKLTSRLVAGQNPSRCLNAIVKHLERHAPKGLRLDIPEKGTAGPGFRLNPDSEHVAAARRVLERVIGRQAALLWDGASIPVVSSLAEASGAEPLMVGFGREEDRVHAPNESFSLEQFRHGFLYVAAMLGAM